MLPVATAIQCGAPKINACVLCVRALFKTQRSFIRSFLRLSYGASYFRRNVPFIWKVRVLFKTRLIFPRVNGPIAQGALLYMDTFWANTKFLLS